MKIDWGSINVGETVFFAKSYTALTAVNFLYKPKRFVNRQVEGGFEVCRAKDRPVEATPRWSPPHVANAILRSPTQAEHDAFEKHYLEVRRPRIYARHCRPERC